MIKKTLLHTVQKIEDEASNIVVQAKKNTEQNLLQLNQAAKKAQLSLQAQADDQSKSIIDEHIEQAKKESHLIIEESIKAATNIHSVAKENRMQGIKKVMQLLEKQYNLPLE